MGLLLVLWVTWLFAPVMGTVEWSPTGGLARKAPVEPGVDVRRLHPLESWLLSSLLAIIEGLENLFAFLAGDLLSSFPTVTRRYNGNIAGATQTLVAQACAGMLPAG